MTVHHGESVIRDDDRSEITEVGIRRRIVTLDWQGIDSETRRTLWTTRSGAKRAFTMTLSRLPDAFVAEGQIEEVTKCHSEENGGSFRKIQDRNLLVEDEDLDECAVYFRETESRFVTMKERISLFKK